MRINRSAWGSDEREEYDELLSEIVAATPNTSERLNAFEAELAGAIQAHRPWARDVERSCLREGLAKEIKRYQDRNRAVVAYDGTVLSMPRVQSAVVRDASGEIYHERGLIELWTWDQVAEKRAEAIKGRRTYDAKIAHYDRLLALRDKCPESANAADAAKRLGMSLDEYLGTGVKAA